MIKIFITRPVLTIVCLIVSLMLGSLSAQNLEIEDEPTIRSNIYYVDTSYSSTIEGIRNAVAIPLEINFLSIPGVELVSTEIHSTLVRFKIIFSQKSQNNENLIRLQEAISAAKSDLPSECRINFRNDTSDSSIFSLYFYSENKSVYEIYNFLNNQIKHLIESINGVSSTRIIADEGNNYIIEMLPQNMYMYNISIGGVQNSIDDIALVVGACNIPLGNSIINVNLEYENKEIGQHPLINNNGHIIYMNEIANIKKGSRTKSYISRYNKKETISLDIFKKPEANMISVCNNINKNFKKIKYICNANNIDCGIIEDKSEFVLKGINGVYKAIIESVILVCVIVFLFLRSLRISIIPIAAIPFSIIPMFLFLKITKTSINVYSLFGIVLAIGLVVDDAIVVVENIFKHIESGEKKLKSTIEGTTKIAVSIIAMTLTLAIVYAPILMVDDPNVRNFIDFALAISCSVLISGVVSLTATPMMFNMLYKEDKNKKHIDHDEIGILESWYLIPLKLIINLRYSLFIVLYTILFVCLMFTTKLIKQEENIEVDKGYLVFYIQSKKENDIDINYIDNQLLILNDKIMNHKINKDIKHVFYSISSQKGNNFIKVKLIEHKKRNNTIKYISNIIIQLHKEQASDFEVQNYDGSSLYSTFSTHLQVYDSSYEVLKARIDSVARYYPLASKNQGIVKPDIKKVNVYKLLVDREKCHYNGITPGYLIKSLGSLHENRYFNKSLGSDTSKLYLSLYSPDSPNRLEDILNIPINSVIKDKYNRKDSVLPLRNFVRAVKHKELNMEIRINGINGTNLKFLLLPGVSKLSMMKEVENFNKKMSGICNLIPGVEEERKINAMNNLYQIFILAIILIYLIISALLNSFITPISIMLTVPASALGGLIMLLLFGYRLNTVSLVGLITLIGLITKHGIMLLDYINQNKNNRDIIEVVIESCIVRFRPILMTTLCMVIGAIPLINKKVEFSEYKVPIGLVIIGGMIVGTILTLFIVPCFYIILEELFGKMNLFYVNKDDEDYKNYEDNKNKNTTNNKNNENNNYNN